TPLRSVPALALLNSVKKYRQGKLYWEHYMSHDGASAVRRHRPGTGISLLYLRAYFLTPWLQRHAQLRSVLVDHSAEGQRRWPTQCRSRQHLSDANSRTSRKPYAA